MKLATWNVNSIKVRMPQLLPWLASRELSVVCLQETKTEDATFPVEELRAAGYHTVFTGQRAYNGVAILSRTAPTEVTTALPGFADEQKRVLAATVDGLMCRHQLHVAWDGRLYDCDFNYAIGLGVEAEAGGYIQDFSLERYLARHVATGPHCFGCTAGAGSSCGGALAQPQFDIQSSE